MQVLLGESGVHNWSSGADKYRSLDREMQSANSHFIEDQQAQQQVEYFIGQVLHDPA